ncbi:MAG: molybdopterin dinucleotide binding domain-containing protein [Thermovirgaceae bacterium]|nr:molybdopterin dinucleotide binding domain-containing protein [Synergistales bacterium]MDI9392178.1 molybdopterin dinucleotide binding domain-containing protein [Synergistota bacterium]MDY0179278.1 molybdopterin dinucleotide binding domain-containing protein [Synergistaceae bacterium]HRW87943.1 molybdopterin dinucleotide binding domain-containing protein [Thermovirgaceae bacterium]MDD3133588.1 molybdopterin dinucleotide binding domain-containing protein [Synergistales bacterium]
MEPPVPSETFNGGIRLITVHEKDYINGQVNGTSCEKVMTPLARLSRAKIVSLGLFQGDMAKIRSPRGRLVGRVHADEGSSECIFIMDQSVDGANRLTSPTVSPGHGSFCYESSVDIPPLGQEAENA